MRCTDSTEIAVTFSMASFLYLQRRYFSFILSDITQKKLNEERIRFLAFLSHELRNPLQIIDAGLHLVLDHQTAQTKKRQKQLEDSDADFHTIKLVADASELLTRITYQVLDLTRLESSDLKMIPSNVNTRQLIQEVQEMMQLSHLRSPNVVIRQNVADDAPERIVLDKGKVEQILINLTTNALKHTSNGEIEISCTLNQQKGSVVFAVADTGVGIQAEHMDKLFKMYQVLDDPTSLHSRGSGLGLVISRKLARFLQGDITVSSSYGSGSTFFLTLPLKVSTSNVDESSAHAENVSLRNHRILTGRKFLVVDDNAMLRTIIVRILTAEGCTCFEANDGLQAIQAMKNQSFDLIILDCLMPVMDGYACAVKLRAEGYSLPIVGLTASSNESDIQQCYVSGFNSCLIKPVKKDQLIAEVSRFLP